MPIEKQTTAAPEASVEKGTSVTSEASPSKQSMKRLYTARPYLKEEEHTTFKSILTIKLQFQFNYYSTYLDVKLKSARYFVHKTTWKLNILTH